MRRVTLALTVLSLVAAAPAYARPGVALVGGNQLVAIDTAAPGSATLGPAITGLQAGETVVGIDYRPANGKLYGLGSTSRLYTINEVTGQAKQVGSPFLVPLSGTSFGFDFNAIPDRIRVVSDNEQNFRLNPETAVQTVDTALGAAGSVGAAAYTNNYELAPDTTLFGIDYGSDSLVRIGGVNGSPSPNFGAVTTIGPLGVDSTTGVSLDLSFPGETAYATIGGSLYTVDLSSGTATLVGQISSSALTLNGIALKPMDPTILYVDNLSQLFQRKTSSPSSNTGGFLAITAPGGEQVIAIDFRPATGELYGLGANSHLFRIDPATAVATQVGPTLSPALSGASFGFDFLASQDRIRIVSDTDQNLRVDPVTAAVQPDASITPGSSSVTALAGSDNYPGSTTSALLGLDPATTSLVRIQDNGTLSTVGPVGQPAWDSLASFDVIEPRLGLATLTILSTHTLFQVDLESGKAKLVGVVAASAATSGIPRGLTIVPRGHFEHASPNPSVNETAGQVGLVVNRIAGSDGRVTIEYATSDGSAVAGQDYAAASGLLEFAPGETSKVVNVPLVDDDGVEDPETFAVTLTDPTNGATVAPGSAATATVTIQSDDAPPSGATTAPGENPPGGTLPGVSPPPLVLPAAPDSSINRIPASIAARKLTGFSGTASDPDGDLARVEVAVVRLTGGAKAARAGCQALRPNFKLKTVAAVRGRCRPTVFLRAKGLARWSLKLGRRLPRGKYAVYSRAVDKGGRRETTFSVADGNRRTFSVR